MLLFMFFRFSLRGQYNVQHLPLKKGMSEGASAEPAVQQTFLLQA